VFEETAPDRDTVATASPFETVPALQAAFRTLGYLADSDLATALFLALRLERPLFLEGEAGVGKTEVARTLAGITSGEFIRLQCYEGIDAATALYEWDYARQMLEIRLLEARGEATSARTRDIFGHDFLVRRPLLRAIESEADVPPVLLIDEIDRADEEFEAFLLELLADFAITIPELGTIQARVRPRVILTSNRTREVHDALKRRCFYHWIDYPTAERELAILRARLPGMADSLRSQVVAFVQRLRTADLSKVPGVAETIDWAAALESLGANELTSEDVDRTLGILLKYQEDVVRMKGAGTRTLLEEATSRR
jgi:MoxR-like ATPase